MDLRLGRVLDAVLQEPDRDPRERAVYRVRMARAEVVAASADDPAQRRQRIEELLARSAELLEAFPDHPAAATWRLDRAEDAWRWLWPLEAAGLQVMLGVPDAAAVARADRAVAIIVREVPAAATALEETIERLEFSPGWPDDPAVVREHRRLVEEEREGRLPILRAIARAAAVLRPAVAGESGPGAGAGSGSGLEAGARAGTPPATQPDTVTETDAPREARGAGEAALEDSAAIAAIAALDEVIERFAPAANGGGGPDAAAGARASFGQLKAFVLLEDRRFAAAADAFARAAEAAAAAGDTFGADVNAIGRDLSIALALAVGAPNTNAATRGERGTRTTTRPDVAREGRAAFERLAARASGALASSSTAADFLQLLAADAAFRAGAAAARAQADAASDAPRLDERDERDERGEGVWDAGIAGWRRLAERDRRWFAVIRDRFARSLRPGDPVATLPPVGQLGWSDALRSMGREDAAIGVLAGLATDGSASDEIRSEAFRAVGMAASAGGRVITAARATLAAAVIEPDDERAAMVLDAALRLAAVTEPPQGDPERTETDGGPPDSDDVTAALAGRWPPPADPAREPDPLVAAVRQAEDRHADLPDLDRWRTIAAGRLVTAGRTIDAERLLGRIAPGADEAPTALATGIGLARARLRQLTSPAPPGAVSAPTPAPAPAATIAAAASTLLERVAEAERIVAAGGDPDGRLAARIGRGRGGVLAAEAHLATGHPERALASLLASDPADATVPRPSPSLASDDRAVVEAAADLGVRALLVLLPDADRPHRSGDATVLGEDAAAGIVARLAGASPRAARTLVGELGRRVTRLEDASSGASSSSSASAVIDAAAILDPLRAGLASWLREPAVAATDDEEAARALRAIAFREIGRAELTAGRPETALDWFAALGGVEASDPAVLLGAAEARFQRVRADVSAGADPDAEALAEAMGAYRRLAGDRGAAGDRRWWTAQLRMLQILDLTGRGAVSIAPRIRRLMLTEPDLGGPGFKPAFESLAARYGDGTGSGSGPAP